jgi:hypothetical protein
MTTDIGKAGKPAALTDKELDAVTGGIEVHCVRHLDVSDTISPGAGAPGGHVKVFSGAGPG